MKYYTFSVTIIIGILSLTGCKSTPSEHNREFYTSFSIGEIVAKNDSYLLDSSQELSSRLLPGSRILNGMEAGPREPFIQKYEEINIQINEANLTPFLVAVKEDIEKAITDSGATIQGYGQGGGTDSEYFSYDYAYDQVYGTIHVWAVRGPGGNMNIIVLLTED